MLPVTILKLRLQDLVTKVEHESAIQVRQQVRKSSGYLNSMT